MNNAYKRALMQIHCCVFLWGFTAILGKLISMPASALVVWRMALVAMVLACLPSVWRAIKFLSRKLLGIYAGIGLIVALHWLTFYGAIKLSNASVAVSCLALGSVFAAFIEPVITGKAWSKTEVLLGVLAVPGVMLLVGGVPTTMHLGIAVGIVSAFLTSLFAVLNKRYVNDAPAETVTFIEMSFGACFLAVFCSLLFGVAHTLQWPSPRDFFFLLLLAMGCTLLPFILSLHALRHISAFSTQLALNLEPVYAILIAALWFKEHQQLTTRFYLGVAIILLAVSAQPILAALRNKTPQTSA